MIRNINEAILKKIFAKDSNLIKGKVYKALVLKKLDSNNFIIKIGNSYFFKVKLPSYIKKSDVIKLLLLNDYPKYKFKFLQKIDNAVIYKSQNSSDEKILKSNNFKNIVKDIIGNKNANLLNFIESNNTKSLSNIEFNNFLYFLTKEGFFIPLKVDDNEFYCKIKQEKDYSIIKIAIFLDNEYFINVLVYKDKRKLIINFFSNNKKFLTHLEEKKETLISKHSSKVKQKELNKFNNNINNEYKNKIEVKFYYEK